jgi:TatD DNase family protein
MCCLRVQISLAIEFKKPLYLHVRNAFECFKTIFEKESIADLMKTNAGTASGFGHQSLKEYFMTGNGHNCVVHCFTGSLEELQYYVNMGCYIGLTGHVLSLPVATVHQMLQLIPLQKLVIETDAPYMGFKGCREGEAKAKSRKYPNVPAALPKIAAFLAEVMGVSYDTVCLETTKNALSFFKTIN